MIYLGVGSSIGPATKVFAEAERFLAKRGVTILKKSKIHKTKPMGGVAKNKFSNAVWGIKFQPPWYCIWGSKPHKLLRVLKRAEKNAGRDFKADRWADRELDLDILTYEHLVISTKELTIPHVGIKDRDFVLKPWAEIVDKNFVIVGLGKLAYHLNRIKKQGRSK